MATQETFLDESDYFIIGEEFRKLWNTRRLALGYPTATVLRYTEYPNPESLTSTTIVHSGLSIGSDITGRTINLVEGNLDTDYIVTGYTATSITVSTADFIADGFTISATFHIEGLSHQKEESPTKVQVLSVGSEVLTDREVAYYNLTEKEILQFGNELDMSAKRFVFYDIVVVNDDIVILEGQDYSVVKTNYNPTYNKTTVYGKAIRQL